MHRIGRTGRAGASGIALSLMTGSNDDRLLADIEKLTKRKLPAQDLAVDATTSDERREPREARRPDRDADRGERGARSRYRAADDESPRRVRPSLPPPPRVHEDPFFTQPYEPALESVGAGGSPAQPVVRTAVRRPSRPVAALLGGIRKP